MAVAESTAEGRFPIASRTDMCMNIQDMVELIRDRPVAAKLKRTYISFKWFINMVYCLA